MVSRVVCPILNPSPRLDMPGWTFGDVRMLTEIFRCDRCGVQVQPHELTQYKQTRGMDYSLPIDLCPRCELQFRCWFHDDAPNYSDAPLRTTVANDDAIW